MVWIGMVPIDCASIRNYLQLRISTTGLATDCEGSQRISVYNIMAMASADPRLLNWSARFQNAHLARQVVTQLKGRAENIWRGTFELLRKESPEYRNAVDDEFTAESKSHCGELLETIVGIASGHSFGDDPFDFVRRHAEWRARHQVPLVASLHAYRLAHKTYWGATREPLASHRREKDALRAISMLSDFWIGLFGAVGAALYKAHASQESRVV